ncbi:MAG: LCP family protein [Solirubrobacterales bacterium]
MSDEEHDQSTEEHLMAGNDDLLENPESEPVADAVGADGPVEDDGDSVAPATPPVGQSGGSEEGPPTEEIFASAVLTTDEDVPELDPVFRAALLESPESEIAEAASTGETGTTEASQAGGDVDPITGQFVEVDGPDEGEDAAWDESDEMESSEFSVTEEQTLILAAAARSEVHQVLEAARKTGRAFDPPRPPVSGDFEPAPKGKRLWWRFSLATLIIVFSFAGATSASVLSVVNDLTDRFSDPAFRNIGPNILPESNGGPQTIAILGSDARTGGGAPEGDVGRSDTTILLRLDPESGQIAMLSIPRDLKVEIPGYGTDKFNAAYSYGGTKLALQTIRALTGLQINHVVNVDFQGFAAVVDAIGCVFVDVDREYYNSNEGVPASEQYAEIDIQSGYQKLCGPDALEFARYRHTDTDLVRASRQQDLIGEVRNRLSFAEIINRRNELIDAFAENTRSDISGSKESLELLKLLFDSREARVVEITFPATLGSSYVTATSLEIQGAVDQFLGFEDSAGPVGTSKNGNQGLNRGSGQKKKRGSSRQSGNRARKKNPSIISGGVPGKKSDELVDAAEVGLEEALLIEGPTRRGSFDTWYTKRLPSGAYYSKESRSYHIRDPDKNVHAAYRMVMVLEASDGTHYFGLQGIRGWADPPILEAPHEELQINGRDFKVYTEGDQIRLITWFENGNTYWLSNSLLLKLTNNQMLGMARATRVFTPN